MKLNWNRVGLIVGSFFGVWHLFWSVLVALRLAQGLLDWIYGLHFLNNPFHVNPFNPLTALELIAVTFAFGYVIGWLLALLWNFIHKESGKEQKGLS